MRVMLRSEPRSTVCMTAPGSFAATRSGIIHSDFLPGSHKKFSLLKKKVVLPEQAANKTFMNLQETVMLCRLPAITQGKSVFPFSSESGKK